MPSDFARVRSIQDAGAHVMHGLMDTRRAMSEEATTPDLVDLTRESMEAANRLDFDAAVMSTFAPDAVFDVSSVGLGTFEGATAIRGYLEDWIGAYEAQKYTGWEGRDLGCGVVFVVADLDAQPVGSTGTVHERWSFTVLWTASMIAKVIARTDINEARAAAERLAEERG